MQKTANKPTVTRTEVVITAKNRKGETISLPAWLIAPSGGFLPFESVTKFDYVHLRPVVPRTKESLEAARKEYDAYKAEYGKLAQKAAAELSSKEAVRLSARKLTKGKNKDKYGVSARYVADGGSLIEQLANARTIAQAARDAAAK